MPDPTDFPFIPYTPPHFPETEMQARAAQFHAYMDTRRSVREFSDRPVPRSLMETLILTASTAPSGAHKQPWTFCLVGDPSIKHQIRMAAEAEEKTSYGGRMTQEWLDDLAPLGTDWQKPFLETAPWLVVCFKQNHGIAPDGTKRKHYYVNDSVGLACGFFLAAVHNAGLVSLTHTPSPMDFLTKILNRPENERPFLLMPVGYAADSVQVPDLKRKGLAEVMVEY
jgi:iodotyrosine deiodinase